MHARLSHWHLERTYQNSKLPSIRIQTIAGRLCHTTSIEPRMARWRKFVTKCTALFGFQSTKQELDKIGCIYREHTTKHPCLENHLLGWYHTEVYLGMRTPYLTRPPPQKYSLRMPVSNGYLGIDSSPMEECMHVRGLMRSNNGRTALHFLGLPAESIAGSKYLGRPGQLPHLRPKWFALVSLKE